ncbi:MAG: sugar ABC transporter permease [Chloroflexota bacterium]|nr:sugar ABC transporter permease [Chloroflexota bacterium]
MSFRSWSLSSYQTQTRLFLVPYLLGTLVLVVLPALATVAISFTEYNAIRPPTWVGLENFAKVLSSPLVRLSLRNSFLFVLLAVPLRILGALLLALLLQPAGRHLGFFRTSVYIPTIIPETAYALIWLWVFNPLYGPLNAFLNWLGLPVVGWLVEPQSAQLAMVVMALFQIGEGFIVALVALRTIPRSLYEAATVDGANKWQSFWRITLPLIVPWLLLLSLRDLVVSLQNTFAPTFIMTYGGPYYATTYVPLLLYELGFDFFKFGEAAALLVVFYVLTGLLAIGMINLVGLGRQADIA